MALYFAARGIGEVENSKGERTAYTSPARVLFNGLGSDELLGGYGRHRTAYSTGGWRTAIAEVRQSRGFLGPLNIEFSYNWILTASPPAIWGAMTELSPLTEKSQDIRF